VGGIRFEGRAETSIFKTPIGNDGKTGVRIGDDGSVSNYPNAMLGLCQEAKVLLTRSGEVLV
jgi:hypothetical protein